jgi:hypothetical protein
MDLAHLVGAACVKEDALGRGRLACVDVRGNADVPYQFNRVGSRHRD